MRYRHSQGGWTGSSLNDKAIVPLAHGLHSCSQLVRDLTSMFIILSVKLTDASVMVNNALQIGKDCMQAYEFKLPQGLYNNISNYVVTVDTPMEEGLTLEQSQLLTLKSYST